MSNSEMESNSKFPKITTQIYNIWAIHIRGQPMTANTWWIVTGDLKEPNPKQLESWLHKKEAVGIIIGSLSHTQYTYIKNEMEDPAAMWKTLKNMHHSWGANSCYHAM